MSESIWNKTYTLGNSQETEIVGGTGIKVDDSVPGVIGISTDETVLYDNPTNHNVATDAEFVMSESLWNFHRAFIEFDNMEFTNQPVNMEIDLDISSSATNYYTPMRNANSFLTLNIPFANFSINSSGNIKYSNRGLLYGSWTSPQTTTGELRGYRVRKVIGINRIAGGNA